jgi:translation initiation factor 2A
MPSPSSSSASAAGASSPSSAASRLGLVLRTKEAVLFRPYSITSPSPASPPDAPFKGGEGFDGSSAPSASTRGQDGVTPPLLAVADKEGVDVYDAGVAGVPVLLCRLPQPGVATLHFSPLGGLLVTWHRKKADEANVQVWSVGGSNAPTGTAPPSSSSPSPFPPVGTRLSGHHLRSYTAETWPCLKWTADEALCAKVAENEVQVFDGRFASNSPLHRIPAAGVTQVFVGPPPSSSSSSQQAAAGTTTAASTPTPVTLVTFSPRTKSRPAAAVVWAFPKLAEPTAAKTLQADACSVAFSPDGASLLLELSTSASDTSYYGDSRLFLVSRDGRTNVAVAPPKEGPTHDFAWSPQGDYFIVIAGRTPPIATLYSKHGAPTFTFGAGAHNTLRISPNGRVAVLAGFGNMAGNMWFWDVKKQRLLGPQVSAPCTVHADWAPDSRHFLTAVTRPRLQVDNGYRVWDYHGTCVAHSPFDFLYQAEWRQLRAGEAERAFPDRAPSPQPSAGGGGAAAAAAGGAAAPTPQPVRAVGVYRPPGALGSGASASAAAAIMKEAVPAGKLDGKSGKPIAGGQGGGGGGGAPKNAPGVPLGAAPEPSARQRRRAKLRMKRSAATPGEDGGEGGEDGEGEDGEDGEGEGAASAAPAPAPAPKPAPVPAPAPAAAPSNPAEERAKLAKKLQKKLKEITDLKAAPQGDLDAGQREKLLGEEDIRAKLAELGV